MWTNAVWGFGSVPLQLWSQSFVLSPIKALLKFSVNITGHHCSLATSIHALTMFFLVFSWISVSRDFSYLFYELRFSFKKIFVWFLSPFLSVLWHNGVQAMESSVLPEPEVCLLCTYFFHGLLSVSALLLSSYVTSTSDLFPNGLNRFVFFLCTNCDHLMPRFHASNSIFKGLFCPFLGLIY